MPTAQRSAAQKPTDETPSTMNIAAPEETVSPEPAAEEPEKPKRSYRRPVKTLRTFVITAHESVEHIPDVMGYVKAAVEKAGGVVTVMHADADKIRLRLDTAASHAGWKNPKARLSKAQQDQLKAAVVAKATSSGRSVDDVLAELLGE